MYALSECLTHAPFHAVIFPAGSPGGRGDGTIDESAVFGIEYHSSKGSACTQAGTPEYLPAVILPPDAAE